MSKLPPAGRVLVVVDSSSEGEAAIQSAAALAAELSAELLGLFVENVDLLRLAELPFAAEVIGGPPELRRLDRNLLERMLQNQAEQARRTMAEVADRLRVQWSFHVARGQSVQIALAAAGEPDSLMIRLAGRVPRRLIGATKPVRGPTMVVFDAAPNSEHTLEAAARLSDANDSRLVVVIGSSTGPASRLRKRVMDVLSHLSARQPVNEAEIHDLDELLRAVRQRRAKLLVMNRASPLLTDESLALLTENLDCPVLLVG